ncbi:MAG TPA: tetratricopeptide repeat protein [Planctomycetaceae bacterium]
MFRAVRRLMQTLQRRLFRCFGTLFASVLLTGWFWSDFCLWRADANLVLRKNKAAEGWVERSRWGRNPAAPTCLLRLRLARRAGDYREVERLLHQARHCGVPDGEIRREQWLAMAQTQQFDQVSSHWQELLADPRDDEPEIARAFVVWASSRHLIDEASRVLALWEQDYPDDPEPSALQGQMAQAMNHWEGAVEGYRRALALAPGNDSYRLALAVALQNRMQLEEAAELFRECLQRVPDNSTALRGLADTYASQGELEKALTVLQDAINRFPDDLGLHQTLGEVYLAQGADAAAVSHLERAYAAHPENADLAYSLARALKAVKRDSEAAPLFDFVAESREPLNSLKGLQERLIKHPDDIELLFRIADISAKYKSRREAIRWLEKLLLTAPNDRAAHEALGELYRLTGDPENATRHRQIAGGLPK